MSTDGPPRPRLAEAGPVYITLAAAEQYAAREGVPIEGARKELTALLARAKLQAADESPMRYRYRSTTTGLDITARVVIESPLDDAPDAVIAVVVSISVRDTRR